MCENNFALVQNDNGYELQKNILYESSSVSSVCIVCKYISPAVGKKLVKWQVYFTTIAEVSR